MSNCMNIVIFLCLCPVWFPSDVKLYEYCDILMFVSRMVSVMSNCMNIVIFLCLYPGWSLWCQTVWILWYSYVCIQDGLSVMSNCMNIVTFLCLCPGWSPSDVKLYEYCDILMFVSRMVSVMSNCMNIVIFLCLYPGWSLWCQTVWILWYSYVCIQDGLPVMPNCMNNVIFLCLYPEWSLCDVKVYEYCDILIFVFRMVSQWCQTVWILWYSYVCVQDGLSVMSNCMNIVIFLCLYPGWFLSDVKYFGILMFVSKMVSVMSNCMNIVIFLCLYPGWPSSDVKLYEYCDILMFVLRIVSLWCQTVWILWDSYVCLRMVSLWCQSVWILWYSFVCVQDGLSVMSNCMNIMIFLCLCPGWSPSDVKLFEYCDILMFVSRMVSLWCQTVWILWYSYVCGQGGLLVMNIVIFLCLCLGWSLSDVKLYEYCDILMFVSRMVSQWCQTVWILWYSYVCIQDGLSVLQTVWILWYSYVCIQDGLSVMSNCMNIVMFLCLYPKWSPSDVKLYEYCDILMFLSRMA